MRDGNTYWAIVSLGLAMVGFFIAWPVYAFFKYYVRWPFKRRERWEDYYF